MLWMALHLPVLSLEAFCAGLPAQPAAPQPVALLAEHHVSAANSAAEALGVRPGQRRATALALATELLLGWRLLAYTRGIDALTETKP